jgi:hypothetical protein
MVPELLLWSRCSLWEHQAGKQKTFISQSGARSDDDDSGAKEL